MTFTPLSGETHHTYSMGAAALTLSLPLHAGRIMMQALTQNIRYTLDGTTPNATTGFHSRPVIPRARSRLPAG